MKLKKEKNEQRPLRPMRIEESKHLSDLDHERSESGNSNSHIKILPQIQKIKWI